jgi:hypothetical protein
MPTVTGRFLIIFVGIDVHLYAETGSDIIASLPSAHGGFVAVVHGRDYQTYVYHPMIGRPEEVFPDLTLDGRWNCIVLRYGAGGGNGEAAQDQQAAQDEGGLGYFH